MIEPEPPENPVDRKICRLHVFAGDEYVGQYDGSGMAVSTPTGSTGVALSANGPVHYPDDNFTLQVVPLLTHRMGARPLIVSAETELTVVAEDPAMLTVDGGRFVHPSRRRRRRLHHGGATAGPHRPDELRRRLPDGHQ